MLLLRLENPTKLCTRSPTRRYFCDQRLFEHWASCFVKTRPITQPLALLSDAAIFGWLSSESIVLSPKTPLRSPSSFDFKGPLKWVSSITQCSLEGLCLMQTWDYPGPIYQNFTPLQMLRYSLEGDSHLHCLYFQVPGILNCWAQGSLASY
ncbi:UNVERIFIED_CONTAM: hypothetical protein K2H54_069739 [Gekko kuhli]